MFVLEAVLTVILYNTEHKESCNTVSKYNDSFLLL